MASWISANYGNMRKAIKLPQSFGSFCWHWHKRLKQYEFRMVLNCLNTHRMRLNLLFFCSYSIHARYLKPYALFCSSVACFNTEIKIESKPTYLFKMTTDIRESNEYNLGRKFFFAQYEWWWRSSFSLLFRFWFFFFSLKTFFCIVLFTKIQTCWKTIWVQSTRSDSRHFHRFFLCLSSGCLFFFLARLRTNTKATKCA